MLIISESLVFIRETVGKRQSENNKRNYWQSHEFSHTNEEMVGEQSIRSANTFQGINLSGFHALVPRHHKLLNTTYDTKYVLYAG